MASEAENLDKCNEVILDLVQKSGDVSLLILSSVFEWFLLSKFNLQLIASRFWKSKTVQEKLCETDLVTETDREVEKLLIDSLTAAFPHHR